MLSFPEEAAFSDDLLYLPRGDKLTFLDINDPLITGNLRNEIRLARQKCRYLKDIENFRCGLDLFKTMDIGKNGNLEICTDIGQMPETIFQPWSPKRMDRRSVGLIV